MNTKVAKVTETETTVIADFKDPEHALIFAMTMNAAAPEKVFYITQKA